MNWKRLFWDTVKDRKQGNWFYSGFCNRERISDPKISAFCLRFYREEVGWFTVWRRTCGLKGDSVQFSSVQSLSHVWLFATLWITALQASLSITNSQSLLKLTSIESMMPSNHLILCHPLLPPIPPSIRVFSNESTLRMWWPKYWSFSFSISPSNEHPGLIFRMDWLDLLAVQGTLKSLLQQHSSKASIFRRSAFLTVQVLHSYMTTGKTLKEIRYNYNYKVQCHWDQGRKKW